MSTRHFVDVDDLLDESVGFPVISLQPQKLPDGIDAVHVLGVQLTEFEESIDIVGVSYYIVFFLN